MRPPELLWVSHVKRYYRYFHRDKNALDEDAYRAGLESEVMLSYWMDGNCRRVRVYDKAIPDLYQYLQQREPSHIRCHPDIRRVIEKLYIYHERENAGRRFNRTQASEWAEMKQRFVFTCNLQMLPVPVTSTITPTNATRFVYHILLSFGSFDGENLLRCKPAPLWQSEPNAYFVWHDNKRYCVPVVLLVVPPQPSC